MFCNTDNQPFQFAVSRLKSQNHLGTGSSIPRKELLNPPPSIPKNLFSKTSKGATSRFIPVSCGCLGFQQISLGWMGLCAGGRCPCPWQEGWNHMVLSGIRWCLRSFPPQVLAVGSPRLECFFHSLLHAENISKLTQEEPPLFAMKSLLEMSLPQLLNLKWNKGVICRIRVGKRLNLTTQLWSLPQARRICRAEFYFPSSPAAGSSPEFLGFHPVLQTLTKPSLSSL